MKTSLIKRIIAPLLILVLLCGIIPTVLAADGALSNFQKVNKYTAGQFTDVKSGDWFEEYVAAGYEYGLIKGTSPTSYSPDNNITIAQSITLAARLHAIFNTGNESFVQGDPWYQVYVDYAVENRIIGANEYSNFNAKATRAQFACILAMALPDSALQKINDITYDNIPDVTGKEYYAPYVCKLYKAGVLTGSDGYGTFYPKNNIKRSEVAAIVTRMADPSLRKTFTLLPKVNPAAFDYLVSTAVNEGEMIKDDYYRYVIAYHTDAESGGTFTTFIDYNAEEDAVFALLLTSLPAQDYDSLVMIVLTRSPAQQMDGAFDIYLYDELYDTGSFELYPDQVGKPGSVSLAYYDGGIDTASLNDFLIANTTTIVYDMQTYLLAGSGYTARDLGFALES